MSYLIPNKKTETIINKILLVVIQVISIEVQSNNIKEFRNKLLEIYFKAYHVINFGASNKQSS